MHKRLARLLIRLYPRSWRDRYEDEMLALIGARSITIAQVFDIGMAVMRERVRHFSFGRLLLAAWGGGAVVAALGLALAVALQRRLGMLSLFQAVLIQSPEGLLQHHAPIAWLGFIPAVMPLVVIARAVAAGYIPIPRRVGRLAKIGRTEMLCWMTVLLASATIYQLLQLTSEHYGSSRFASPRWICAESALQAMVSLQFLISSTRWYSENIERLRAAAAIRSRPPQIILGLNA